MRSLEFPQAVLILRESGDFLAVSAPGETVRLAVVGNDESAAREAFSVAAGRWLKLCEAAEARLAA